MITINSELERMTLNGGCMGDKAISIMDSKQIMPLDLPSVKDGDIFALPTSTDVFGIQKVRGNEAPFFMVEVQRGKETAVVPVYLSQLTRRYFLMENNDFKLNDKEERTVIHSEGPLFDLAINQPSVGKVARQIIDLGNTKNVKKIKVVKKVIPVMAYNFESKTWEPKDEQTLFDFVWA